ncbi:MAG: type II toxin-antitoxin system VapC family toxin [Caulobacteraceae bacterium]
MFAIDTNVIVRYVTGDDPIQSPKARALIEGAPVFVTTTVLLETEWVLRRGYSYSNDTLVETFQALAGLPTVALEDEALAATAIDWLSRGMDFADALHLAAAAGCDAFMSFDQRLGKTAFAIGAMEVRAP